MVSIREERDLTSRERRLLDWLIRNGTGASQALLEQLGRTRVVSKCGCGCPTIDLAVGDRLAATTGGSEIVADAHGVSPEGVAIGTILHVREGILSELEIYAQASDHGPFTAPDPERLEMD